MVKRFEVHLVNLEPTVGSQIQKTRPCLLISPDEMNRHIRTVIVAPMTSKGCPYPMALEDQATSEDRLRELIEYHGKSLNVCRNLYELATSVCLYLYALGLRSRCVAASPPVSPVNGGRKCSTFGG